jgi:hypothetical protein
MIPRRRKHPAAQWRDVIRAIKILRAAGIDRIDISFCGTPAELASVADGDWQTHVYEDPDGAFAIDTYVANPAPGVWVAPSLLHRRKAMSHEVARLSSSDAPSTRRTITIGSIQ